jgi:fluoroacetyl-CoA thioesterase
MAEQTFTVTSSDTARSLGSGELDVLGTPAVLAWMEKVTLAELAGSLRPGEASVGTRVELEHLAAAAVGATVRVTADLAHTDGRLRRFTVAALDESGRVLANATVTRVVVDRERFLRRMSGQG